MTKAESISGTDLCIWLHGKIIPCYTTLDYLTNQNGRWDFFTFLIPCSALKLENVIAHTRFSISNKLPKGSLSSTPYNHVLD